MSDRSCMIWMKCGEKRIMSINLELIYNLLSSSDLIEAAEEAGKPSSLRETEDLLNGDGDLK